MDQHYEKIMSDGGSLEDCVQAGWFEEVCVPDETVLSPRWMSTSVSKASRNLRQIDSGKTPAVLLMTGAFDPVHMGHLDALQAARKAVENSGEETVVCGYIAPDHDSYVSGKRSDSYSAARRVEMLYRATSTSHWMEVDPWSALYAPCALNFTTLLDRLKQYLDHHLDVPVKIYYVFGSDNADFGHLFQVNPGLNGICVSRPGSESRSRNWDAVLSAHCENVASSTLLRSRSDRSGLEVPEVAKWLANQQVMKAGSSDRRYAVRNDLRWSLPDITEDGDLTNLMRLLGRVVSGIPCVIDMQSQVDDAAHVLRKQTTISLDPCYAGTYSIELSRVFDCSSGQAFSRRYAQRPESSKTLFDQMADIPPGRYTVVDDDIATGGTMQFVQSLLPSSVVMSDTYALLHVKDDSLVDIVDARDFFLGGMFSGLVIEVPA